LEARLSKLFQARHYNLPSPATLPHPLPLDVHQEGWSALEGHLVEGLLVERHLLERRLVETHLVAPFFALALPTQ